MAGSTPRLGIDMRNPIEIKKVEQMAENLAKMDPVKGRSLWQDARKRFFKNRAATASLVVLGLIVLFSAFGGLFANWPNDEIDWSMLGQIAEMGQPSIQNGHYFGVDELGRDLFARTIQANQISLIVGFVGAAVAVFVGTLYGAISGYAGGRVDSVMMRIVDILSAVPYFFIVILLLVVFGRSIIMIFVGIGLVNWLSCARIVRGQTLSLKQREFVQAAQAMGVPPFKIVVRHIIPNLIGVVIVYGSLLVPEMILAESVISFLGVGVQEPQTSLGVLISEGTATMQYGTFWQLGFPLAFFTLILFCFFYIGDGLRDALDPKDR
jgi:oligopeptide transport system permease protein